MYVRTYIYSEFNLVHTYLRIYVRNYYVDRGIRTYVRTYFTRIRTYVGLGEDSMSDDHSMSVCTHTNTSEFKSLSSIIESVLRIKF